MKRTEYVLIKNYVSDVLGQDTINLPAGSFVTPIDAYYIPKSMKESTRFFFNPEVETYCYTWYGIIILRWDLLRQV